MAAGALVLQTVALALARCTSNDVSQCPTDGVEGLVTATGGSDVRVNGQGGFGAPSSALTLSFLKNGVPAWADLAGSQLKHPPTEVDGIPLFVPSAQLASGSELQFHCPANTADVCDAWVFFYNCPQSCTIAYQGGVPAQLGAAGWEHTNCAPRFVTGVPSGYSHQMRSYRTKVAPGQTVSFTTAATAEFLAFGLDKDAVDCSKLTTETTCEAAAHDSCKWSPMGECVATRCRRGGQGPPPPCTECPWQGIVKRDATDGPFGTGP